MHADKSSKFEDFLRTTNSLRRLPFVLHRWHARFIIINWVKRTLEMKTDRLTIVCSIYRHTQQARSSSHFSPLLLASLLLLWKKCVEMCRWHSLVMSQRSRKVSFWGICRALSHTSSTFLLFALFQYLVSHRNIANQFSYFFHLLRYHFKCELWNREEKFTKKEMSGEVFYCVQNSLADIDLREVDGFCVEFRERSGNNTWN